MRCDIDGWNHLGCGVCAELERAVRNCETVADLEMAKRKLADHYDRQRAGRVAYYRRRAKVCR
jgi:hypothetical protein